LAHKISLEKDVGKRNVDHSEVLMQMEYIQLQIKVVDHKITLVVEKTMGMDLTEPRENHQHVSDDVANYPPVNF
jgi:hypothetical protein